MISVVRTLEGCYDILAQLDGEEQFEDVDFAFLSDRKLLNSAMSRAKNKIIVVGDASTMIFLGSYFLSRRRASERLLLSLVPCLFFAFRIVSCRGRRGEFELSTSKLLKLVRNVC